MHYYHRDMYKGTFSEKLFENGKLKAKGEDSVQQSIKIEIKVSLNYYEL